MKKILIRTGVDMGGVLPRSVAAATLFFLGLLSLCGCKDDGYPHGCHYDCFGYAECYGDGVRVWEHRPVPCNEWSGECPNYIYPCEKGCRTDISYQDGPVWGDPGYLCEENRPKLPGDPCVELRDCFPRARVENDQGVLVEVYLTCDTDAGECVEVPDPCSFVDCSGHGLCRTEYDENTAYCMCDQCYVSDGPVDCVLVVDPSTGWECTPAVFTNSPIDVWAAAGNDVWVVAGYSNILHWDGSSWSEVHSEIVGSIYRIWGLNPADFWVSSFSGLYHSDGRTWTPVEGGIPTIFGFWGATSNDVWAVGHGSEPRTAFILHWDGIAWTSIEEYRWGKLAGVWGFSGTDIWVVGERYDTELNKNFSRLLHWDGNTWSDAQTNETYELNAVWGSSADDVWAVGERGVVLHWDGVSWSRIPSGTRQDLYGVWGLASDDVWAVGSIILHWNGIEWRASADLPWTERLHAIHGADGEVWAVGSGGIILHRL